jgi:FtsH-binding integral membrane protein
MATGWQNRMQVRSFDQAAIDAGLRQYMLSIYNYMTVALVITGLVAFGVAQSPALMTAIFGSPLKWVVMLAPLGVVFFLSARINSLSLSAAQMWFWVYAVLVGLSLSVIFLIFTGASIARVFFITAAAFGATSLYGYTTRTDLSRFGAFLFMGVVGIIVAMVANWFLHSPAIQFAISVIGVLLFTGLTAFDTQQLKEMYADSYDRDTLGRMAIFGALKLYIDFINMFTFLLQLVGQNRD